MAADEGLGTRTGVDEEMTRPQVSTRDLGELRMQLQDWLATRRPGSDPVVFELEAPTSNGMSSETVLFDASWEEDGSRRAERLVARVAPEAGNLPVFPVYDLGREFRLIGMLGELGIPVPPVFWFEPDPGPIGSPFFVMGRVDGIVPPDVMPYNFGSWLMDAAPEDQRRLQDSTLRVIGRIHDLDRPEEHFSFLAVDQPGDTPLRRHVAGQRAFYEWVADDLRLPLLEAGFAWLEDHWPEDEGETVLAWGDARIGNVLYRDFEPAALLDWEMATLGPRELDLGWFVFLHRFFEDIAHDAGLPGMPDFLQRGDVAAAYESFTGYTPRHLDFYETYAALRHGIVMARTERRRIHFGEATMPVDPDDLIMHRRALEAMLAGTYWD
jgi:aminoglycoside phosphotransferase (APT) family kinase protein